MKIRIMGSADLVEAWAAEMRRAYGVEGRIYPCRGSTNEVRFYCDVDDRVAAQVAQQHGHAVPALEASR